MLEAEPLLRACLCRAVSASAAFASALVLYMWDKFRRSSSGPQQRIKNNNKKRGGGNKSVNYTVYRSLRCSQNGWVGFVFLIELSNSVHDEHSSQQFTKRLLPVLRHTKNVNKPCVQKVGLQSSLQLNLGVPCPDHNIHSHS